MRRPWAAIVVAAGLVVVGAGAGALVLGTQLTANEKQDLVAFLRAL